MNAIRHACHLPSEKVLDKSLAKKKSNELRSNDMHIEVPAGDQISPTDLFRLAQHIGE